MNIRSAVFGTTTLVVLLTAGAAQSLTGSNTVYTDDIVNGQVTSADIANGTITSTDIKDGSATGADVKDGSLTGTDIADNSVKGADVDESSLTLTCPTGMTRFGDVCSTDVSGGATDFNSAFNDCLGKHLRLPTLGEVGEGVGGAPLNAPNALWTDGVATYGSTGPTDYNHVASPDGRSIITDATNSGTYNLYVCVTSVGARP